MTERVSRLSFSLDPLMAEAKRLTRRRRLLVAGLALVLIAAAAGMTLALRGPGPGRTGPSGTGGGDFATTTLGRATLTYPAAWKSVAWNCWTGPGEILLLTTARPTPTCGSSLPPREELRRDGVAVWLVSSFPLAGAASGILIRDPTPTTGVWSTQAAKRATCITGAGPRRRFGARLQEGRVAFVLGGVVCGPNYSSGEQALQRMLSSVRFGN